MKRDVQQLSCVCVCVLEVQQYIFSSTASHERKENFVVNVLYFLSLFNDTILKCLITIYKLTPQFSQLI